MNILHPKTNRCNSDFSFIKKAGDREGLPFIGGEIQFTADFVEYQQIVAQACETTFCTKPV